jgi:hypothetical protein
MRNTIPVRFVYDNNEIITFSCNGINLADNLNGKYADLILTDRKLVKYKHEDHIFIDGIISYDDCMYIFDGSLNRCSEILKKYNIFDLDLYNYLEKRFPS